MVLAVLLQYLRLDGGSVTNQFLKTVKLYDNVALWLGDNNDLQIYHDGNDSYISDTGTGILFIRASSALRVQGANGESMIDANENGAVTLYYDNSAKLDTTSFGVNVTGQVTAGADKATPEYSFKGDQDTGVNQPGGVANQVGFMNDGKDTLTMLATGQEILNQYTASAVTTTNALNPNQNFQAASQDTLATLAVDVNGYVVRGSQEGTWTFTKAQLDALTTSTTSGTTLISAPGATKAIIVEESNLMIKYSGTGTMSSNSFVIRQAHNGDSSAEVTRLPSGQINTIMSSAPANPSYGFYSRDLPLYNNDGRSFVTNKATFLSRINTNATPSNLTSITIKLKYRLFDVSTF